MNSPRKPEVCLSAVVSAAARMNTPPWLRLLWRVPEHCISCFLSFSSLTKKPSFKTTCGSEMRMSKSGGRWHPSYICIGGEHVIKKIGIGKALSGTSKSRRFPSHIHVLLRATNSMTTLNPDVQIPFGFVCCHLWPRFSSPVSHIIINTCDLFVGILQWPQVFQLLNKPR